MTLRHYQKDAHDAAINFMKKSTETCLIEAEGGSGKSHIIAAIADTFHKISGKHVLCTAPNVDLVKQNNSKFLATGNHASIFSASISKSLRWPVVFGTPITIGNEIHRFCDKFGLIVIDEAHGITPTIKKIINSIKERNKNLRVIGLSATPYRLGTGYIYELDENGKPSPESACIDPYFKQKIYTIKGRELIEQGFLTPPVIGAIHADSYETLNMRVNSMGKFYQEDIDKAYSGQERKTSRIIADIVEQSRFRRGVMIFASTVEHAKECMKSLPPELSRMIGGDVNMGTNNRKRLVSDFREMKFKYLVSVGTMTTGVDFPHVDVIALLRPSESIALLRQIILRGARLFQDKPDFLILDYCQAIERHCPDHDIFNPQIKAFKSKGESEPIIAICPDCNTENEFTPRRNEEGFKIDEHGYFIDLTGERITTDHGAMPAHYGRRCYGQQLIKGQFYRCEYRWTFKPCPECDAENDIAARYCIECKAEIVDPNEKLIADFRARKRDPYQTQCDKVMSWEPRKSLSKAGKEMLVVDFLTEYRKVTAYYQIQSGNAFFIRQYEALLKATNGGDKMPETITYRKDKDSGFYRVLAYNQDADGINGN